jgi:hypothetical protein
MGFQKQIQDWQIFSRRLRSPAVQLPSQVLASKLRQSYTSVMSRGWESKSVEAQQLEAAEPSPPSRTKIGPEEAAKLREKENLSLARQRILQQIETSHNPRHRKLLDLALAELDERLRKQE